MTGVAEASGRPLRPERGDRGRDGGGVLARGGCRAPGVGVRRPGRHQVCVRRAWCSAFCTAGLSRCRCLVCSSGEGQGRGWGKGMLAGNIVGCAEGERGRGTKPGRWRNAGVAVEESRGFWGVFIVQLR